MAIEAAVELYGVSRVYRSRHTTVRALDNVTVEVPAGTWTAVMGPSGSGKSTLLHCAAGLEQVTDGRVLIAGQDITGADEHELTRLRRTVIGFVFQSFNLIGSLTASQNVAMPLRLAGQRPSASLIRSSLADVGLADRARHRPRELSGGQQQRVAIARVMATRPAVLFADEPTGALDSRSARVVLDLLRSMVDGAGQTIVMVTHDPVTASSADRVIVLSDGRAVDQLDRPTVRDVTDRITQWDLVP